VLKNIICTVALAVIACSVAFANGGDENDGKKLPGFGRDGLSVVVNENDIPTANGQALTGVVGADGNTSWILPFGVFPGDLLITEPGVDGKPGILSDVLRFGKVKGIHDPQDGGDLTNLMTFYSDGEQPADSPADLGLPANLQHNQFEIVEPASENMVYHAGAACYNITSDSVPGNISPTPEPCTLALLALGGLPLAVRRRQKTA
jgi:hypothetical protein